MRIASIATGPIAITGAAVGALGNVLFGGGFADTITGSANAEGRITVTDGFASEALKNALAERDEILSSRITAGEVGRESVLHVAVTPRQNTSPREVAAHVDTLVTNLAALTGQNLRAYISIHSGLRAKLARENTRVH